MKTDYNQQATDFLNKWGISFQARATDGGKCPPFCDGKHVHGDEYKIKLIRPLTGAKLEFPFWNSMKDAEAGKEPTAYDVLACISGDLTFPDDFREFCSEYGYYEDSRKAYTQFKLCSAFGKKLRAFFSDEEMQQDLQTIN